MRSAILVSAFLHSLVAGQLAAQEPERAGPTDPAELEAFLDGFMAAELKSHDVAGATVAVVRDGELLFSKGYGWADVEARRPVDPATTLFRIGSVTKLFTWTAVMQQVEEGRLNLDVDVNEYLDFGIPDSYPEPITLRHILTHTPGFEDRAFGLFGRDDYETRGEWLEENLPARVRPPGRYGSYSNYASALAGYIVERVSGLPWEDYVEARILRPLGMEHATPRQPLPDALEPHMSGGYAYEGGRLVEKPFEWVDAMAPAGSMSASAEAMVPFMVAHLQGGRFGDARILEESTAREMHARTFAHDPRINGSALGFYEQSAHGVRIIGHGGGTQWFFSNLLLFPEQELGVFVSFNTATAGAVPFLHFPKAFLDRYWPLPFYEARPAPGWEERAAAYAGRYRMLRHSHTTFEKLLLLMFQARVEADEEGEIVLHSPMATELLREVEPGYLRAPDGFLEATFQEDPDGGYSHLFLSAMPSTAAERAGIGSSPAFHLALLAFSLLLFVSALVLLPVRYAMQRSVEGVRPLHGPERIFRWAGAAFAALSLAFLVGFVAVIGGQEVFLSGETEGSLRAILALPVLSVPLAVVVVAGAVVAFRRRLWSGWGRVHYALVALAAIVFLALLYHWNLLGWRL